MLTRGRGQVVVIFAAALPVVLGFLGLALDGGYYFLAGRAVQFAAGAAARAAAVNIQANAPAAATANGQALGAQNLAPLQLTGVTVTPTYKTAVTPATECTATSAGWSGTPATAYDVRAGRGHRHLQHPLPAAAAGAHRHAGAYRGRHPGQGGHPPLWPSAAPS